MTDEKGSEPERYTKMKIDPFCCCLLLSTCCWGQNIVGNPSGSQTIVQPTGTEFNVNRFEATRYADQFPGSDIGAQINNAYADCAPTGGCRIRVPARTYTYSTPISIGNATWAVPSFLECDPGYGSVNGADLQWHRRGGYSQQ